jgi:hypothetical protein
LNDHSLTDRSSSIAIDILITDIDIVIAMLNAFKASIAFLQEHKQALGANHRTTNVTVKSELLHLTKLFRNEPLIADDPASRSAITSLIQHMRACISNIFTADEIQQLIEIAASRLTSQSDDVTLTGHGSQKGQTHLHSHRYLTSPQWDYIMDETITFKAKQTFLSKAWLGWGLRFPSGPTFRSGLALLAVASKLDEHGPDKMHEHLLAFQKEFRKLREIYPGTATQKVFPSVTADFQTIHPTLLGEVVECRVDTSRIIELSHPSAIPVKLTNASLKPGASSSSSSPRTSSTTENEMLRNMLNFAMGKTPAITPASPAPARRRAPAASDGRAALAALADREEPALVAYIPTDDEAAPATPEAPAAAQSSPAALSAEAASLLAPAGRNVLAKAPNDQIAQQTEAFILAKKIKRAAEAEAAAKAAATAAVTAVHRRVNGKSSPSTSASSSAKAKTSGTAPKATASGKAKASGKGKAKAKKPVATPHTTTHAAPPLDMDNTVVFGGGKLYNYPKRNCFRVWSRRIDKKDTTVSYGKSPTQAQLKVRWSDALKVIKDDPRPVN